ncbi:MAG: sulfotransferase [Thermodesulfovibrionales bacterium]
MPTNCININPIKRLTKKVPILGSFIWWVYMILKTPSKINELFSKVETFESAIKGINLEANVEYNEDIYTSTRDGLPKYNNEGLEKDKHFFFIAGTPRSGTKWFSHFFTTDKAFCFHELTLLCHGDLQKHRDAITKCLAIPYDYDNTTKDNILISQLRHLLYLYPSFGRLMYHKLYESEQYVACGNSDCAQTNLSLALQQVFPKSKILMILRNGFDVALSLEEKQKEFNKEITAFWENKIKEQYRYKCESSFELACGRWHIVTERMLQSLRYLSPDKTMIVNFEKAFSDVEILKNIWDFLLDKKVPFDRKRAEMLLNEKINTGEHKKVLGKTIKERWANLEKEKRDSFMKICGSFMSSLPGYEGWPDLDF